jgi:hypothetical protein
MLTKPEKTLSLNSYWTMLSTVALLVTAPIVASSSTNAASFSFTPIDVPGATFTSANGVNDAGQIVGLLQTARVPTASSTPAAASPKSTCWAHSLRQPMASTTRGRSSGVL